MLVRDKFEYAIVPAQRMIGVKWGGETPCWDSRSTLHIGATCTELASDCGSHWLFGHIITDNVWILISSALESPMLISDSTLYSLKSGINKDNFESYIMQFSWVCFIDAWPRWMMQFPIPIIPDILLLCKLIGIVAGQVHGVCEQWTWTIFMRKHPG